jgi:hypothetical protein
LYWILVDEDMAEFELFSESKVKYGNKLLLMKVNFTIDHGQ